MQGQRLAADPARVERRDQPVGEVQRRGRRRDRAFLAREHRLIIGRGRPRRPARLRGDIGRQRHPPGALEQQLDRLVAMEMRAGPRRPRRCSTADAATPVAEIDPVAEPAAAWRCGRTPTSSRGPSRLCSVAPILRLAAPALELGRDDLGVVEHQHVAGPQQRRQVEHRAVGDLARPRPAAAAPNRAAAPGAARSGRREARNRKGRRASAAVMGVAGAAAGAAGSAAVPRRRRSPPAPARRARADDLGRLGRRLAGAIASTASMPDDHPAEDGIFVVERDVRREHDEELAVGAVRALGARHRRRRRACAAGR